MGTQYVIFEARQGELSTRRSGIGAWRFFSEIDENELVVFLIAAQHRGAAH